MPIRFVHVHRIFQFAEMTVPISLVISHLREQSDACSDTIGSIRLDVRHAPDFIIRQNHVYSKMYYESVSGDIHRSAL